MKKVTNDDIGGGGSNISQFHGDVIFEWSLFEITLKCSESKFSCRNENP